MPLTHEVAQPKGISLGEGVAVAKAINKDGVARIRLIGPGWGSSGFYSKEMLQRDGPAVFKANLPCFWNHPTVSEESDRPERNLSDMMGVLASDAAWKESGTYGPGLYADMKVFDHYRKPTEELAPHIGMSIRAMGEAKAGEAEGRKGRIIERMTAAKSVDAVTVAGANGAILQLFEAARQGITPAGVPAPVSTEGDEVDKDAFERAQNELKEARDKIAELEQWKTDQERRAAEAALIRAAHVVVVETLATIARLPTPTRERLTGRLAANPPTKDGTLDTEALVATVKEAADAELDYLASVGGGDRVRGMGGTTPPDADPAKMMERLERGFAALGLSETVAKHAAAGWDA